MWPNTDVRLLTSFVPRLCLSLARSLAHSLFCAQIINFYSFWIYSNKLIELNYNQWFWFLLLYNAYTTVASLRLVSHLFVVCFFLLSFRSRDVAINLVWLIYTKNTWRILCVTNYVVALRFTLYTWKIYVPNIRENIKYYAMVIELKHRPTRRFARSRFIEMKSKIIYYIEMQNSKTARR